MIGGAALEHDDTRYFYPIPTDHSHWQRGFSCVWLQQAIDGRLAGCQQTRCTLSFFLQREGLANAPYRHTTGCLLVNPKTFTSSFPICLTLPFTGESKAKFLLQQQATKTMNQLSLYHPLQRSMMDKIERINIRQTHLIWWFSSQFSWSWFIHCNAKALLASYNFACLCSKLRGGYRCLEVLQG